MLAPGSETKEAGSPELTPDVGPDAGEQLARKLEAVFSHIAETAMAGIPILNPALSVRAIGMRVWGDDWMCVLITPWFINLLALPVAVPDGAGRRAGEKDMILLPAGRFEFIQAHHDDLGPYRMCSLFSPVLEFGDQDTAVMTAEQVMLSLFAVEEATSADSGETRVSEDDSDDSDDGMALIWAGRIDDANERARAEAIAREDAARKARLAASPVAELVKPDARPDRRALFGLGPRTGGRE